MPFSLLRLSGGESNKPKSFFFLCSCPRKSNRNVVMWEPAAWLPSASPDAKISHIPAVFVISQQGPKWP